MATGNLSQGKLEIRWDGTTWSDESCHLMDAVVVEEWEDAMSGGDKSPRTASFVLINPNGRFTPTNLASPISAHIKRGVRVRYTPALGSRSWQRFDGEIIAEPTLIMGSESQIKIVCGDKLAVAGQRILADAYRMDWERRSRAGEACEFWPFDDGRSRVAHPRQTVPTANPGGWASVIYPSESGGGRSIQVSDGDADGFSITKALALRQAAASGPIIGVTTSLSNVAELSFCVKPVECIKPGYQPRWVAGVYDNAGYEMLSIRLFDYAGMGGSLETRMAVYDNRQNLVTALSPIIGTYDDSSTPYQWWYVRMWKSATSPAKWSVEFTPSSGDAGWTNGSTAISSITIEVGTGASQRPKTVVLGGRIAGLQNVSGGRTTFLSTSQRAMITSTGPVVAGAQTDCTSIDVANVGFRTTAPGPGPALLNPGFIGSDVSQIRRTLQGAFADPVTVTGANPVTIWYEPSDGITAAELASRAARTSGSWLTTSRTDGNAITVSRPADAQPSMTLNAALDGAHGGQIDMEIQLKPGVVKAQWADGEARAWGSGTAEISIDTAAYTAKQAYDLATWILGQERAVILDFEIDLATASEDIWDAAMALKIGSSVTLGLTDDPNRPTMLTEQLGWASFTGLVSRIGERYDGDGGCRMEITLRTPPSPVSPVTA